MATVSSLRIVPSGGATATARDDPAAIVSPSWPEPLILVLTLALYVIAAADGGAIVGFANHVGPILLTGALVIGCVRMVRANIASIWTSLLWMRVALIVYFGAGTLIIFYLNAETRQMVERFFLFFPGDVLKYNSVSCLFALILVLTPLPIVSLTRRRANGQRGFWRPQPSALPLKTMAFLFLGIGLLVNDTIALPFRLGLYQGTFPVAVSEIGAAAEVGYFLVTLWALRTRSNWRYITVSLAMIESLIGVLSLAKGSAIFPLLMLVIAYIYHRPTALRVAIFGGALTAYFLTIAPAIAYARDISLKQNEDLSVATLSNRVAALTDYYTGNTSALVDNDIQTGWARLSYVNAGTFAINRYDNGQPGDSLANTFIVWIPRIIYPDKPIITNVGITFNLEATGSDTTSSSPTIPAEGYWAFGWPGVLLLAFICGVVATFWSLYSLQVITHEAWYLFSIVLIGMRVGGRLDGFFVGDVVGPVAIAMIGHMVLNFLNRLVLPKRAPAAR